jgi:putative OPT family oligopeptide transporter
MAIPTKETHKPYVPADTTMREFTFKALFLGLILAVVLGAANAYLGLKAGMTIAAAFPAAVIAIAAFRMPFFKGTVLEQNISRTIASVGESMAAAAIFIIPAFVMVNVGGERLWTSFNYWQTAIMLLVGGLLGCMFIILLRRTLTIDADLPFPEAAACYEMVRTGQKGESGARYVFGALGLGILLEIFKNPGGIPIIMETKELMFKFPKSIIHHFNTSKQSLADIIHGGGISLTTPLASPALMGVGYIIGPKYSTINFTGGVLAWLVFIPLALFLNPSFGEQLSSTGVVVGHGDMAYTAWYNLVRPFAVGAMLVGSFYTLYGLRNSIFSSFKGVFTKHEHKKVAKNRLEIDINLKVVLLCTIGFIIPMVFLYHYFTGNWMGAILAAIIMTITGFLFAAVSGWLAGLVGLSNQPMSGLILSSLLIAALLMVAIGMTGMPGIAAALGVATVISAAVAMSGDMIQDLKIGRMIGGTPWKMEFANIVSTVVIAFIIIFPLIILHKGNIAAGGIGIGDTKLPAPQAGLMAQLATGIISGEMPWGLIVMGMFFSMAMIMLKAPSPMLIAVGMYLPFETTFAIFIGGSMKWVIDRLLDKMKLAEGERDKAESKGILLASGFIAGEAITGVLLAGLVMVGIPSLSEYFFGVPELPILGKAGGWISLILFGVVAWCLIRIPLKQRPALR